MASIVTLSGVSFELPNGRELFQDLNLALEDQLTALVGPNGVGKTCLARLLVGELAPTRGTIRRHAPLVMLPQREPPPAMSVGESLSDSVWSDMGARLLRGIDMGQRCDSLSGGEWMRVRLARTLEDGFLILDEPTNDLDREARLLFREFLLSRRGGALLISHDRECLALCQGVLELSTHGLSRFGGGWHEYQIESRRERERLESSLERARRAREIAREAAREQQDRQAKRNQRGARQAARGGMPKILLGRRKSQAQSTTGRRSAAELERVNEAVHLAQQAFEAQKIDPVMYADLPSEGLPAQKLVAEARGLNVRFAQWLFPRDISFSWRGSTRVALRGANGRGKSTLLKLILGQPFVTRGELRVGGLRTLYLDQRLSALDEAQTIWDCVRAACSLSDRELRNGLSRFLFAQHSVFQPVRELSGGERLRAALARGFLCAQKPELLVLDEPTNNLDLPNVEFLEGLVRQFRGALVVVSHDEEFLDRCDLTETFSL